MSSDRAITTEKWLTAEVLRELPIAQLVGYVQSGTEQQISDAFLEIARRFEPLLRKTWKTHGRGEYADFAHDVFARTFATLARLNNPIAFPAFFRTIVHSVAADQWRKRTPDEVDVAPETLEERPSDMDEMLVKGILLRSYLEHLDERQRQVLEWDLIEDLPSEEIAGRLGMTSGAVRTIKSRALERLRAIFSRDAAMIERLRKNMMHSGRRTRPYE
ncbi:MAG TPA: sigma-70 family RNA polymerase sigma factor [Thermoanaerobaculia bacterium]|nr:sigma-70 family RNA polymerase sigma factor [Thermoanaerobaculia bacterium]